MKPIVVYDTAVQTPLPEATTSPQGATGDIDVSMSLQMTKAARHLGIR